MSFIELVDQKILGRLCKQIESKKWATTYLFTGKESERKKALAIAFAKALNCDRARLSLRGDRKADEAIHSSEITPQGLSRFYGKNSISGIASASFGMLPRNDVLECTCTVCARIQAGTHPDVKWYGQDEEANSIKISEIRDFKNWLGLKSFEGKVKVFIFNQAERLTGEAQNALLKSLEEPPSGNVILFLISHRKALFDTISSRAVEIKIPSFTSQAIRKTLIQDGAPELEAEFLARMSQGESGRAKTAYEEKWFQEKNRWVDELVKDPVSFLDQFHGASRAEISRVFDFLVEWLRDILVFHAAQDAQDLIHLDRLELIQSVTSSHDFESALELFEAVSQIRKSIDDYTNQKLVLTQAEVLLEHFFNP